MISARPSTPESGSPPAIDLATVIEVGLDAEVLDREEPAGAAEAGLDLVGDEDDAVAVAEPAQAAHELGRSHDEATFALYGLEHDRRDLLGRDTHRKRAVELASADSASGPSVGVRERDRVDLGRERPEPGLVRMSLGGGHIAISVRPWKPPSNAMTAGRRVYDRAILTAFSIASAPELKNAARTWPRSAPGTISRSAGQT